MSGGFFGGDTDLAAFIKVIAKISGQDVKINPENMQKLADGIGPLGKAMEGFGNVDIAKIVDTSLFGKSTLEIFFDLLSEEKIATVASKDKMKPVADGIALMGNAINTFAKIDMATIVGNNWTPGKETSFESFIGGLAMATEKIKDPAQLQNVAIGVRALGEAMQTFTTIDTEKISLAMSGAGEWKLKGTKQYELEVGKAALQTGGLITTKSAGIFELHQGEMVMDNAAVAAFRKSLDLMNMSQANALASAGGGGQPIIVNNNNVDNSMQSSQTTAISVPEPTRTNESTVRALQNS